MGGASVVVVVGGAVVVVVGGRVVVVDGGRVVVVVGRVVVVVVGGRVVVVEGTVGPVVPTGRVVVAPSDSTMGAVAVVVDVPPLLDGVVPDSLRRGGRTGSICSPRTWTCTEGGSLASSPLELSTTTAIAQPATTSQNQRPSRTNRMLGR